MIRVAEYDDRSYMTTIVPIPHYTFKWDAKVLEPRRWKEYKCCLWFGSWIFWWQVIKYNKQYYVWAPSITPFILYKWRLNVLDIIKFLIKEYGNKNGKICLNETLFKLLKQ